MAWYSEQPRKFRLTYTSIPVMVSDTMDVIIQTKIQTEISQFREKLLSDLDTIVLDDLLKKKNPYLLASLFETIDGAIREALHSAYASSYETSFGRVLENIAIAICPSGSKSGIKGIDLELLRGDRYRLLVSVKSGKSWGNSSSTEKQGDDFKAAKKRVHQNDKTREIRSVMGIAYGKFKTKELTYADEQICGQNFWAVLSGDIDMYRKILLALQPGAAEFENQVKEKIEDTVKRLVVEYNAKQSTDNPWITILEACCQNYSETDDRTNQYIEKNTTNV